MFKLNLETLKGEPFYFVKQGEEGTTYVKVSNEGMFGKKVGLMWLEKCIQRASDREISCKAGQKLDLVEL